MVHSLPLFHFDKTRFIAIGIFLSIFFSLGFLFVTTAATPAEAASDSSATEAVDTGACYTARADKSAPPNGTMTELGCIPKDPTGFAIEFYAIGLGLIGGLSLLFLIFGGYILLTSSGDPIRLRNGKSFIFYALFGLLLAIFGYVFVEVIVIDILKLPDFER